MGGFFELQPVDRLRGVQQEIVDFRESGDLTVLCNALCVLTHLREWICSQWKERLGAADWPATPEEELFERLKRSPSFQVVRKLANRSKHFRQEEGDPKLQKISGFRAGLGRVGDSLGEVYLLADDPKRSGVFAQDQDIRTAMSAVLREYITYFDSQQPGWRDSGDSR